MLKVLKPTTEERIVSGFIVSTRGLFAGDEQLETTMFVFYSLTGWDDWRRAAEHLYGVR